ncbi:MAG: hypothetical protein Tp185DCM00d2C31949971_63 [Prokaryotic dsDNA virus sp.]|uniref:hypothetical protein n=1 Tax=Gammaproteobacteria TaxID=1236 RepID=UPI000C611F5A|nr:MULTISPECIES: hypothetical protein [Gammaproteobacteria]MBP58935.1 hypothetical protein [Idiomarina sp.]QDP60947.1 MAG: hypothetical protein Tp185DCM00d2C31949971_63 [Prokaryotic dsDNA virus sp.]QDP61784.1 MAG: hypothetical protein Tp1111MES1053591_23 [Prokaryotic dsDNA virus sp.]HCC80411.1 hypothetical protein [Methylophaga sp.]|tara:strand:- start:910 stop:1254 length:345 start_codon:yes stop_codon:yes gene_type:complete
METKFTPAPWDQVLPLGGVIKNGVNYPLSVSDEKLDGESWLDMRERTEPLRQERAREAEANIALQKAAPDLYEALHCLTEEVKKMKADIKNHPKMIGHLFEADAALAKARGEQS